MFAVVIRRGNGSRDVVAVVNAATLAEAEKKIGFRDGSPAPAWLEQVNPANKEAALLLKSVPVVASADDFRRQLGRQ